MDWIIWLIDQVARGWHHVWPPRVIQLNLPAAADPNAESGWDLALKWTSAAGGLLAAIFAGTAAFIALRTWLRSEDERAKAREQAYRAQASRVVGTVGMRTDPLTSKVRAVAVVHNRSDLPIYKVTVMITDVADTRASTKSNGDFRTIPPGEDVTVLGSGYTPSQAKHREAGLRVAIWFDDANEVSWLRNDDGGLVEFAVKAGQKKERNWFRAKAGA